MKKRMKPIAVAIVDQDIPPNWARLALGEIGEWTGGGTPTRANVRFWNNGNIPWASPKDMKSFKLASTQEHITDAALRGSATNLIDKGSVLMVTRSGILSHTLPVALTERDMALNQDLKAIKPDKQIDARYLVLALRAFSREILSKCAKGGTTVPSLEMHELLRFQIPVAPFEEQHRIVAEIEKQFTRLEAGVEALKRAQANLKRYRAAVLKAACEGKLVPTEAELARSGSGVPPLGSGKKRQDAASTFESGQQLLARILAERRQNWQGRGKYKEPASPSASGYEPDALPSGWGLANVEQLNQANRPCAYGVLQPGEDVKDGVPFVRVGDINNGKIEHSQMKRITPSIAAQYPRTRLQGGELAITLVGAIGRTAVIPESLVGANTARAVGIIPLTKLLNAHWVEIWFRNPIKVTEMTGKSHEVARKTLNLEDVRAAAVALPPLAEQTRIVAEVERRLSVVEELEAIVNCKLESSRHLSQSILNHAFKGRLPTNNPTETPVLLVPEATQSRSDMNAKKRNKSISNARSTEDMLARSPLSEALELLSRNSTLEELCVTAGYNLAIVSDVDEFFHELKVSLGALLTLARSKDEGHVIVRRVVS